MSTNAGLWIDHKQAIVVFISATGETVRHFKSDADKHHSSHEGHAEDKQQRRYTQQLHAFFDEVINCLKNVNGVLVIGPGDAKTQLKKQMTHDHRLDKCVVVVESADKMTEHQVLAKVKSHFDK